MAKRVHRNPGLGLVVAGGVLAFGSVLRMANDEPAGALLAIAAVFSVLGLKSMLSGRRREAGEIAPAEETRPTEG